jgi:hypothetical protein
MRNELNSPASATRSTIPKRSAMTWNSTIGYAAKEKLPIKSQKHFKLILPCPQSVPARHDATAPSHRQRGGRHWHLAAAGHVP